MDEPSNMCPTCGRPYGKRRRCYFCNGRPKTGGTRQCQVCGKDFHVPQWKLNDTARRQGTYCSRKCLHEAQMAIPSDLRVASVPEGSLQCTQCGEVKPASEFGTDKRKNNGKKSACQDCCTAAVHRWRVKYPERYEAMKKLPRTERQQRLRRDRDLQQKYGLTLLDYERRLDEQGRGCAICGNPPPGNGRNGLILHIDHDHGCCPGSNSCGRCIRGLLCSNCNTMLGLVGDDPERLLAAARYLRAAEIRKT